MCGECKRSGYAVHGKTIPEGWEKVPSGEVLTEQMLCRAPGWSGWERVKKGGIAGLFVDQVDPWTVIRPLYPHCPQTQERIRAVVQVAERLCSR
jgi:hypothetical protein